MRFSFAKFVILLDVVLIAVTAYYDPGWFAEAPARVLMAINLFVFLLYATDKRQSVRRSGRIPERVLLLGAFLFGSFGAMLFMELCRHKTNDREDPRKAIFTKGVPFSCILQILILYFWESYHENRIYLGLISAYFITALLIGLTWKSSHARRR